VELRTYTVIFSGPTRHSVQVTGETVCEAAITGLHLLRQDEWANNVAPGTPVTVEAANPSTAHTVTLAQMRAWAEGTAVNPTEALRKRKMLALLPK
jgi:hypothetical protein